MASCDHGVAVGAMLRKQADEYQRELFQPPTVAEVAQGHFVHSKGGLVHRHATKLAHTPPMCWSTACGKHCGSGIRLARFSSQSSVPFCRRCTAPAKAAHGQVRVTSIACTCVTRASVLERRDASAAASQNMRSVSMISVLPTTTLLQGGRREEL